MRILLQDNNIKIRANLVPDFDERVNGIIDLGMSRDEAKLIARTQSESYNVKIESDFKLDSNGAMQHMEITNVQDLALTLDRLFGIVNNFTLDNKYIGNYLEETNNFIRISKTENGCKFEIVNNEKGVVKSFRSLHAMLQFIIQGSKDIINDKKYELNNQAKL